MDEKIINIDFKKDKKCEKNPEKQIKQGFFHTNPILQQMFLSNLNNNKNKFNFKDLFK